MSPPGGNDQTTHHSIRGYSTTELRHPPISLFTTVPLLILSWYCMLPSIPSCSPVSPPPPPFSVYHCTFVDSVAEHATQLECESCVQVLHAAVNPQLQLLVCVSQLLQRRNTIQWCLEHTNKNHLLIRDQFVTNT